jgi:hypothetical protein
MVRTILSLCDSSGNWSRPYEVAGYSVIRIDWDRGSDVRFLPYFSSPIWGILAAPPCTYLTCARSHPAPTDLQISESLAVVDACLRAVAIYRPEWWCLENPRGRLSRYLGPPRYEFHPSWFGDGHKKRTCLWGDFNLPRPLVAGSADLKIDKGWLGNRPMIQGSRAASRSVTPPGFAQAFFTANP